MDLGSGLLGWDQGYPTEFELDLAAMKLLDSVGCAVPVGAAGFPKLVHLGACTAK